MFSTAMPILYPFACIFYFILYWVYKLLLLKHYKKTSNFHDGLCYSAAANIKYAVIMHLFWAAIMTSNNDLVPVEGETNDEDEESTSIISKFIGRLFGTRGSIYILYGIIYIIWILIRKYVIRILHEKYCVNQDGDIMKC